MEILILPVMEMLAMKMSTTVKPLMYVDAHEEDAIDVDACNGGDLWKRIGDVSLTEVDKKELLTGKWLNDKVIHASQLLLKQRKVGSLQNPLFGQTLSFAPVRDDFVQILHSESHWVTVSTIGIQHPTVWCTTACTLHSQHPQRYTPANQREVHNT